MNRQLDLFPPTVDRVQDIHLSPEETDWCRNPITTDPTAGQRLAAEVLATAIEDHRELQQHGHIRGRTVPPDCLVGPGDRRIRNPWSRYCHALEVEDLIEFFTSDQLERWLEYAEFRRVSAAVIRDKLGIQS